MSAPIILNDSGFSTLNKAMELTLSRHAVLAANLANVNTPGYIRHDMDFKAELERAFASGDPATLAAVRGTVTRDESGPARLDGNNVNSSHETNEMMQNGVFYSLLTKAFNTRINILRTAMRG